MTHVKANKLTNTTTTPSVTPSPASPSPASPLTIRLATPRDLDAVVFHNARLAEETEGKTLDHATLTAGCAAALSDPQKAFYLLAEINDAPVGQLMVTYEWSDWRNGTIYWIQSVYVRETFRRHGIYRALYDNLLRRAREAGNVRAIRLYVERHNARAQAVYRALGMSESDYQLYEVDFVFGKTTTTGNATQQG